MNRSPQIPCGRGGATIRLARDGGVSVDIIIGCESAIGGKSNRRTAPPTLTAFDLGDRYG